MPNKPFKKPRKLEQSSDKLPEWLGNEKEEASEEEDLTEPFEDDEVLYEDALDVLNDRLGELIALWKQSGVTLPTPTPQSPTLGKSPQPSTPSLKARIMAKELDSK